MTLGRDIVSGMRPQAVVPAGVWQGSRLAPGGAFALLGTTMAPGFDTVDCEMGDRESLLASFPNVREQLLALTR